MSNLKTYVGQFKDNLPSGQGKLTIPGTLVYDGIFTLQGEKFHIKGKMIKPDGTVEEGEWGGVDQH